MLTVQHGKIIFGLFVWNIISIQIDQVPSRKVDILSLNYCDRRQLPIFSDGFYFGSNSLCIDLTVAFNKGEITIEFYRRNN